MNDKIASIAGTGVSAVGTATQTNGTLQTISLIITIIGGLITILTTIVIPFIKWWKKAKADGKITNEEIDEAKDIINNGLDNLKDKKGDK